MHKLFGPYISKQSCYLLIRHGIPLGQVAHAGPHFTVRSAVLGDDDLRQLRVGFFDIYWKLQSFFIVPHQLQPPSQGRGAQPQRQSLLLSARSLRSG